MLILTIFNNLFDNLIDLYYLCSVNKREKQNLISDAYLQRQLDHKIDGELKYAYSNLCAPVPNITPLYCTPFTPNGSGTTWTGCCGNSQSL